MKNTHHHPQSTSHKRGKKQIKFFAQFKVGDQWFYAEPLTPDNGQKTIEDCQTFIDYIENDAMLKGAESLLYRIKEEEV